MKKILLFYLRYFPLDIFKKRLASLLSFKGRSDEFIYTNPSGLKFYINLNEYVMKQIFLFGIYEKPYVKLLSSLPKDHIKIILDIGANIGNYTIPLAKAYPLSVIYSFEPNSRNFDYLKRNIKLNEFTSIKANNFGLSNVKGKVTMYFDKENMGAATIANNAGSQNEEVRLDTLDDYCERENIDNLDLVKIDIEGGELNCLIGGQKMLDKSNRSVLQIEIDTGHCKRLGYTAEELFQYPIKFGYEPYLMNRFGNVKQVRELPKGFIGNVIYKKGY